MKKGWIEPAPILTETMNMNHALLEMMRLVIAKTLCSASQLTSTESQNFD
jgi:hypothetical protein